MNVVLSRPISPVALAAKARGFTLLELLVVVLIIGLLTGIVGPRLMGQIGRSEVTAAKAQIDALDKAVQAYRLDMGGFPSTEQGLAALMAAPDGNARWRGPYMKNAIPTDPWGSPYQYRMPGTSGRDYDILSLGHDKRTGGSGDDADLSN
ncbi:type II secretion system major pseudopilin GspG [Ideonella azotifigens]|nr:type II secretion system major pseudopilin GspG [Ideonella azotifigens]MCD2345011.1 type II secretion system major pseudopilin GspG [Ideonella azotifigens]